MRRLVLVAVAAWALLALPARRAWAVPEVIRTDAGDTVIAFIDLMARLFLLGLIVSDDRDRHEDGPAPRDPDDYDRRDRRRPRDARQGFLFSFGIGGASMYVSRSELGRTGAFHGDLRLGYGFSDRFQFFTDLAATGAGYGRGQSAVSWLLTLRGQTVLIGDRRGNGMNLNLGFGLGGLSQQLDGAQIDSRAGLALAGGISFDARLSRWFALSPEIFFQWHAVPNERGRANDVASAVGLQLNFLWYGP